MFGGDHGEREMNGEDEYPPWDGGPGRELPEEASIDPVEFLQELLNSDLRPTASEDIVDALKKGAITSIAGGEVICDSEDGSALVVLWLPFFKDHKMWRADGEQVEHKEISEIDRWGGTEQSIAALSLGFPSRPVELGFIVDERVTVLPWFEFCEHYQLPPQYVLGAWG